MEVFFEESLFPYLGNPLVYEGQVLFQVIKPYLKVSSCIISLLKKGHVIYV